MGNILYNISQVLGIAIIHSLWQGLLIYFLLRVVLFFASGLAASKKYLFAMSGLLAVTVWFAYTLVREIQLYEWLAGSVNPANMPLMVAFSNIKQIGDQTISHYYSIEKYMPYVTTVYVAGLAFNMARIIRAYTNIHVIKHTMETSTQLQQQINSFAKKLNITKKIKAGFSQMVDVPCITGFFKPVILLPITLSTYLEAEEIEAILLHELAHIKRNDYLINLLQQVITVLLFFNPCVLLINKIIGEEREKSCDDLVVNNTQTPIVYVKALFKLEQHRQNKLQLALAVTGKKYQLLNRIERIMKAKNQIPSIRPTLVALFILTIVVSGLTLLTPQIAQGKISVKAITKLMPVDTIPAKKAQKAKKAAKKTMAKNKAKAEKAAAKAKKGITYYNNGNYNAGMDDPKLEKLNKEVELHGNAISKYYDNPEFKAKSDEINKLGEQINTFYNSPEIKQATAEQQNAAAEYEKMWGGRSSKIEELSKQMSAAGDVMTKYYNSKEFKELNARIAKKYNVPVDGIFSRDSKDENYLQYQAELKKNIPADVLQQQDKMKDLGKQMREYTASPEIKKLQQAMRQAGENMRKAYNNPDIKATQEKMRQLGMEMRTYANNPDIKKEKDELRTATEKLREYTRSAEFKKRVEDYQKNSVND